MAVELALYSNNLPGIDGMSSSTIRIQSHNPYEARLPGRRVVSRTTLHLIKLLRTAGLTVVVEPDDGRKLQWITRKGIHDLLADPVILLIAGIPLSLVTSIVANYIT